MAEAPVHSKAKVLLLLTSSLIYLQLWESVIVLCFVVRHFMSIPVLQPSWWRESWLLCLVCLSGVSWLLRGSSSRCHGFVCSLWLWYFLIILTNHIWWLIKIFVLKFGFEQNCFLANKPSQLQGMCRSRGAGGLGSTKSNVDICLVRYYHIDTPRHTIGFDGSIYFRREVHTAFCEIRWWLNKGHPLRWYFLDQCMQI